MAIPLKALIMIDLRLVAAVLLGRIQNINVRGVRVVGSYIGIERLSYKGKSRIFVFYFLLNFLLYIKLIII